MDIVEVEFTEYRDVWTLIRIEVYDVVIKL